MDKLKLIKENLLLGHKSIAKKFDLWIGFILLVIWAVFQYSKGYEFYALFLIVVFLILLIARPSYFVLVAISVLIFIPQTVPTLDTLVRLKMANEKALYMTNETLNSIFTPGAGIEVLPPAALQGLQLLQTHQVENYKISDRMFHDLLIRQRIVESAWPIKMEDSSPYLLVFLDEINNNPACTEIDKEKDIALVYCN